MAILFIFLILENILEKFIPFLNFFDEVLTIFSLVLLVIFRNKLVINRNEIIMLVSFMITIIIGIISNLLAGVRVVPIAVIKDIIQISKFFIIYMFGTSYLYKGITRVAFRRISCFSKAYLVILLIFGLASQFIDLGMTGDKRYFIYSYAFLYSHETFLVSAVIIMISVLLAQNDIKNKYYIIAGFCVLLLTMRSKAIIFMLVVISMEILGQRYDFITKGSQFWKKNWAKIILVGIFVFGVAILFLQSKVMLYVGYGMRAARPALYIVGFKIMRDFFPVGVGFGEFASYISTTYNSPIYTRYGIQEVSGLNYETHYAYVSDTYWPYIFGQLGVLGTISYLIALYYTFKNVVKKIGNTRGKLTAAIALISYMIFACFAESLLTNSDIIIYALTLSYYLNIDGENI